MGSGIFTPGWLSPGMIGAGAHDVMSNTSGAIAKKQVCMDMALGSIARSRQAGQVTFNLALERTSMVDCLVVGFSCFTGIVQVILIGDTQV